MHLLLPIPFSILACYTDITTRKIKNHITYPLILLGICLNSFLDGLTGLKGSILGIIVVILVTSLVPVFKLGGGDLKLAIGYGAFLQHNNMLIYMFSFILITVIGNVVFFVNKKSIHAFMSELKQEIKTLGIYKTQFNKLVGTPFLLGAYLLTILINYL